MGRELREDVDTQGSVAVADKVKMPKTRLIRTAKGELASVNERVSDMAIYDKFTPYNREEPLPEPEIKTNKRGIRFCRKPGEPRFMFNGNEFLKIYRGLGGKKVSLFWKYNDTNPEHRRVRAYLKKRGIPGA